MKQNYYIPLGIFAIIVAGILLLNNNSNSNQNNKPKDKAGALPKEALIKLDKKGFSPNEITIKSGTAIRWKNISGKKQTVNSDDYPTNQKHKELNFGVFANGSSFVYTFTKSGTYGYHNQFDSKQTGKIIVTK